MGTNATSAQYNNASSANPINSADNTQLQTVQMQIKDGDEKSSDILKYAGILAAAALAIGGGAYAIKKGKSVKLENINFDKGVANLKNGKKFTGAIEDTLKNGDKITMKYKDGILQESTRKGSQTFTKVYEYTDGKLAKVSKNGIQLDIENMQKRGLEKKLQAEQAKIKKEAQQRTRQAEKTANQARIMQQEYFSKVDATTGKSAKESAEFFTEEYNKEIQKEAARRVETQKAAEEYAQASQKKYFAISDSATGKNAKDSAMQFMTPSEAIDYYVNEAYNKSNALRVAEILKSDEEVMSVLNPELIDNFLLRLDKDENIKAALEFMKENFTSEEIKKIGNGRYAGVFVQNMFDAIYQPSDVAEDIVKWYKRHCRG